MVQIRSLFTILASVSISLASATQITSLASYSPEQLSSASSRALKSDATLIYDFLADFVSRSSSYLEFMKANSMTYPGDLQNYVYRLQSITDDKSLLDALATRSFPFSEFATMYTKFEWASSFLSEKGYSTIYQPQDFLTENADASVTTSGSGSSGSGLASSTSGSESASSTSAASSSSGSKSATSSTASSTNSATSDSSNGVGSVYIPIISVPVALISVLLL